MLVKSEYCVWCKIITSTVKQEYISTDTIPGNSDPHARARCLSLPSDPRA